MCGWLLRLVSRKVNVVVRCSRFSVSCFGQYWYLTSERTHIQFPTVWSIFRFDDLQTESTCVKIVVKIDKVELYNELLAFVAM